MVRVGGRIEGHGVRPRCPTSLAPPLVGVAEPSRLLLSVKTRTTHVALQFGFLLQRLGSGTRPPRLAGSLSQLEGVIRSGTCKGMRHSNSVHHRDDNYVVRGKKARRSGFQGFVLLRS